MQARTKIAVTGATGRVGRHIVAALEARGHEVVPISRSRGVDVVTGEGLAEALNGVETVVDAATGPSPDFESANAFFTASARNVQEAGARAGVQRIVLVSIIGIERFHGGYNAAKLAQERAHQAGPIPVRILRAAQFHEFVETLMDWGRQGDVAYVWTMRTQLVAARAVAEELARLATEPGGANGGIPEIAGPRAESLVDAARLLAARRGEPARVEAVPPDPSDPDGALYEAGAALPGPGAVLAGPTFEEWLDANGR
jgi:uncharacterized protein YbjT (DUF2867 family)